MFFEYDKNDVKKMNQTIECLNNNAFFAWNIYMIWILGSVQSSSLTFLYHVKIIMIKKILHKKSKDSSANFNI